MLMIMKDLLFLVQWSIGCLCPEEQRSTNFQLSQNGSNEEFLLNNLDKDFSLKKTKTLDDFSLSARRMGISQ